MNRRQNDTVKHSLDSLQLERFVLALRHFSHEPWKL